MAAFKHHQAHPKALDEDTKRLQTELLGLVFSCPYTQDNPAACPFHSIRTLAPVVRVRWLQTLAATQLLELKTHHCRCLHGYESHSPTSEFTKHKNDS